MLVPWRALVYQMMLNLQTHVIKVTASLCHGGHDIFAAVRENSPMGEFIANVSINGNSGAKGARLCLTGENAGWFYIQGRTIRLNSSSSRVLDREVEGAILMTSLTCYEENLIKRVYRVIVEILNVNDNSPRFVEKTIQPQAVNELTALNSVVFSVKANDADGDRITYIIHKTSRDASYFRIDHPSSGMIVLNKALDFETKAQFLLAVCAVEMNTMEKHNTTTLIKVNVLDGDDQYPHFLPCTPVPDLHICTNPLYTSSVSEEDENVVLRFTPGPIRAVDGDRDILTPLTFTILSGDDNGRFTINRETGEVTLRRRVENRLLVSPFRLQILAAQADDPKKFTGTLATVHVVAPNRYPPFFNKTIYKGFVTESSSAVTLVSTYGNQVLIVQATDRDFRDGINPKITYDLRPVAFSSRLYHITESGVLIAKSGTLKAFDRHILEVVATDSESGEVINATVDIEVLPTGQKVPKGPFEEERLFGEVNVSIAGGFAILLLLMLVVLCVLPFFRRCKHRDDPGDRGPVALGKHPNVEPSSPILTHQLA